MRCPCLKNGKGASLGKPHNFTVYSDLHEESIHANKSYLDKHMRIRSELPRAKFFGIGDFSDFIVPSDTRRFTASNPNEKLRGVDDYIDVEVDNLVDRFGKYDWLMIGEGNHCHQVLKRHHTDPAARFSRKIGAHFGGYSGFIRLKFVDGVSRGARCSFTMLYHHGAWGGKVLKGFGGARDYARHFEGWDVFVYGHNHHCNVHHEAKVNMNSHGTLEKKSRYFVNTGTFYDGITQKGPTSYAEVSGYAPVALAAPLITVYPTKEGVRVNVTSGDV